MKKSKRTSALAAMLLCLAAAAHAQEAQKTTPPWEKIKLADAVQSIKLTGDLRLRLDARERRGEGTSERTQNRFRLRLGAEIALPKDVQAIFRLASGTGEQVSANQTYNSLGSQKGIWIDQAYGKWSPKLGESGSAYVASGKMQNLLWRAQSSDLLWDEDFNPEGFAEGVEFKTAPVTLFANALQMSANETSGSRKSQWLFSQQVGAETPLPREAKLRIAAAYHKWSDENRFSLSPAVAQDGNRRSASGTTGVLLNRFGVAELTAVLSGKAGALPVSLQVTVARNMLADIARVSAACQPGQTCPAARDGYQIGAIVGQAKKAKTWEAGYFRKYAQTDVTVADVTDSDFGDGGTNRQGHIAWIGYAPEEWLLLRLKGFVTKQIDTQFVPANSPGSLANDNKAVNRLQADVTLRF